LNLIIDIGNTRIKAGLFRQNELKHFFVFEIHPNKSLSKELQHSSDDTFERTAETFFAANLFKKYSVKQCILATVVDKIEPFINRIKGETQTLLFTSEVPTPLINRYKSIHTLGSDRLAAAVGGSFLIPNKNVLVIDAGTCIKYNFVNNNEYIGGAISPGLQMRFNALHTFTSRLPLLELDENFDTLIGTNTNESILSGIEIGAIAEAEGFIGKYKHLYPDLNVVLTGGDTNFFEKRLKSPIFTDSFLILKGLNRILEYNLKRSDF